ncbi:MAG: phosphatidylserine decarboxylase [Proteobacteria bacterium]|nr:phosphatidylserine decarboxylase [Pseudomonadota bacterium]
MRFAVLVQYALPHRALSRLVYWATRWTWRPWKDFLIGHVLKAYRVDMSEAEQPDPFDYPTFNAFFTRALRADARPLPDDPRAMICPADGRISQFGTIRDGRIFQAKGHAFSAADLLGDAAAAAPYADGRFVTIYLSPRDYHRVHAPLAGTLRETVHIPGRLFSVAPFTVDAVPRLFARNERLVCHFEGAHGPFVVVMVGAMLVSGVETVWSGVEIPPYASAVVRKDWREKDIRLDRGAELARFNMGSTVILLLPSGTAEFDNRLSVQMPTEMGMPIGRVSR